MCVDVKNVPLISKPCDSNNSKIS